MRPAIALRHLLPLGIRSRHIMPAHAKLNVPPLGEVEVPVGLFM